MKNIIFSIMILIGCIFASCMSIHRFTSVDKYEENIEIAKQELHKHGYKLSGHAN